MIIRDAVFSDFEVLLPMAIEAHKASVFGALEMNHAHMQRAFVLAITFDQGFAQVVVRNGQVVGGMVGITFDNHFGIRCAQDLFTLSSYATDRLIRSFKRWAVSQDARFISVTDQTGTDRYQKLLTRLGFLPSGVNYVGVL